MNLVLKLMIRREKGSYLQHRNNTCKFSYELYMPIIAPIRRGYIPSGIVLMNKIIPANAHTTCDHPLGIVSILRNQPFNSLILLYEIESLPVCAYSLHQAHSMRIDSFCVFSHICYSVRYLEIKPQQIPYFLEEGDDLRIEIDC